VLRLDTEEEKKWIVHNFVYHNDCILPLAQARLSPGQAGLFNGWGVFTTIRIYERHPFAFERHWKRLHQDAKRIQLPFEFVAERVLAALAEVIRANQVVNGCARLYFVYNKVGFWRSDEPFPETDLLICSNDLPVFVSPTALAVQEHGRYTTHPLAGTKVISWLHNVWSLEQARQRGFDEVILLNERSEVAECTSANVFSVRSSLIQTPPLSSACLAGVTREVLLEIAGKISLSIKERSLTLKELYEADEIFITSTSRALLPVGRIEDHQVPQAPGPLTTRLAQAFSEYVAHYCERSAVGGQLQR
jgi:branched-chain amino acid aminotransferase